MKKFTVLLGTLALALGFGVAVGAHSAEEAKAETTTTIGDSGKIFLQLNTDEWKSSGSKIGLYMFNNSVSKSAWGDLVTPSGTSRFVEYSYNLDFTPLQCIAFRFDPGVETMGDWCFENDRGNTAIWSTTNDTDFNHVVWLGNYYPASKWTESGAYDINAVVKGGASDEWSEATVDVRLTKIKVNGADNLEAYGTVALPAGTYFKVVKGGSTWCGSYSAHPSIQSNLSGGGESNIHNTEAATYEFYFDYDGETVYITDPVQAAADEYAQSFLSSVTCNGSAVTAPEGTWGSMKTAFNAMDAGARSLLTNADAKEDGSYIEQAVARYDLIIVRYGTAKYEDFMGRIEAGKLVAVSYGVSELETNSAAPIIIVVSAAVSLTAIGLVLVLRKKRNVK